MRRSIFRSEKRYRILKLVRKKLAERKAARQLKETTPKESL